MIIPKIAVIVFLILIITITTTILLSSIMFYYSMSRGLLSGANYTPTSYAYLSVLLIADLFSIWNLYRIVRTAK